MIKIKIGDEVLLRPPDQQPERYSNFRKEWFDLVRKHQGTCLVVKTPYSIGGLLGWCTDTDMVKYLWFPDEWLVGDYRQGRLFQQ